MLILRKTPFLLLRTISRPLCTQIPSEPTNSFQYDQLINAAGRDKDFAAVRHLLNKRSRDGFFNTNHTFKFISTDLSILDDLLQNLKNIDRGFAKKGAYDSLIARLSKLHQTRDALRVVNEMVAGNVGANTTTFQPVLSALTKKQKIEDAWRVIDLMKEIRIRPDVTAYNFILTAHCFVGDVTAAARVMQKIEKEGMVADSRTYDALVLGACKARKVEAALVLLRRMVDDGLPVLYCTHMHIIAAMLKMGYYSQAVEFVLCYGGRDMALDTESFGVLAMRLFGLKKIDEAKLVVEEMKKRGLRMGQKLKDFCELHSQN